MKEQIPTKNELLLNAGLISAIRQTLAELHSPDKTDEEKVDDFVENQIEYELEKKHGLHEEQEQDNPPSDLSHFGY